MIEIILLMFAMAGFQNLKVYEEAELFYQYIQPMLKSKCMPLHLKDQLDRAASSIILNIAEGYGKNGVKDKRNFYTIARGSANESQAIIRIARTIGCLKESEFNEFISRLEKIGKMLTGLVKSMTNGKYASTRAK